MRYDGSMKVYIRIWSIVFLALISGCTSVQGEACSGPKPRIAVFLSNVESSRGFLKWDCPVFANYPDGKTIWRRHWDSSFHSLLVSAKAPASEVLQDLESLIERYSGQTFILTSASDPERLSVWANGHLVQIFGDWRRPRVLKPSEIADESKIDEVNAHEQQLWSSLPMELRLAIDKLSKFEPGERAAWNPQCFVLLLQPPIASRQKYYEWPANWPKDFSELDRQTLWSTLDQEQARELLSQCSDGRTPLLLKINGQLRYGELRILFPGQRAVDVVRGGQKGTGFDDQIEARNSQR